MPSSFKGLRLPTGERGVRQQGPLRFLDCLLLFMNIYVIIRKCKNSEYIEILRHDDLTFRPIVGGPNNVTQRLSNFIDIILKPLCQEVPSFIRDDLDFLTHLPEIAPVNSELITFDVVSLYTNIPHDL